MRYRITVRGRLARAIEERIGEISAEIYVRSNYPNAQMLWPRNTISGSKAVLEGYANKKSGQFDQIWLVGTPPNQRLLMVEAKGPGGQIGKASGIDVQDTARGDNASSIDSQQGTPRYTEAILKQMADAARLTPERDRTPLQKRLITAEASFTSHMRELREAAAQNRSPASAPPLDYIIVTAKEPVPHPDGKIELKPPKVQKFNLTGLAPIPQPATSSQQGPQ